MDDLVDEVLPYYVKEVKKHEKDLYKYGQLAGKAAIGAIAGAIFVPPNYKASKGPKWLPKVINPVIDPFLGGLKKQVLPTAIGVAALIALVLGGAGAIIGYKLGRRRGP